MEDSNGNDDKVRVEVWNADAIIIRPSKNQSGGHIEDKQKRRLRKKLRLFVCGTTEELRRCNFCSLDIVIYYGE